MNEFACGDFRIVAAHGVAARVVIIAVTTRLCGTTSVATFGIFLIGVVMCCSSITLMVVMSLVPSEVACRPDSCAIDKTNP